MPTSKSSLAIPILAFLILLIGMGLPGCGPDTSLSSGAEPDMSAIAGIPASEFEPLSFRGLSRDATAPNVAADDDDGDDDDGDDDDGDDDDYEEPRPRTVTEFISAEQGGQLLLDWEIKDEDGVTGSKVKAEIKIFPGALGEDAEITIGLLNPAYAMVGVDLEFGEHGSQFSVPAELSLDLTGLDLSAYETGDAFDFYWYDPGTDAWFPVPRDENTFEVKLEEGQIKGTWYLSHFSRYSMSGGRR